MQGIKNFILNKNFIVLLLFIIPLAVSTQLIILGTQIFQEGGLPFTYYNNYLIFKHSFFHLVQQQDIYTYYMHQHFDLYKYTPTFSVFFGLFAYLPDWLGLSLWLLLNCVVLVAAVYYLPHFTTQQKGLILLLCIPELVTSLQNTQSNILIAGLIILAFGLIEKEQLFWAAFCIVFTVYIKLFGIVALVFFLFSKNKLKSALYTGFWVVALAALPLVFISFTQYAFLFNSWLQLLSADHSESTGLSVIAWLQTWFGLQPPKMLITILGAIVFLSPLVLTKKYDLLPFRLFFLSSVLLWIILFNHKAESPTFIIAVAGVFIWFFTLPASFTNKLLLALVILFTCLSASDLFPKYIRDTVFIPYVVKVVPCILVWGKLIYDSFRRKDFVGVS